MNRIVPTFRPPKESVATGTLCFSLLATLRDNALVNGILLLAAADLADRGTVTLKVLCYWSLHFPRVSP
ncbi:hypothetical protein [Streptomyces sp. NPDC048845]|uniref:hypothetical protein n=1 Tax=Streptomyces sp. NPDC048845 TaxID=3155390 RepID=UPI003442BC68